MEDEDILKELLIVERELEEGIKSLEGQEFLYATIIMKLVLKRIEMLERTIGAYG